MRGAAGRRRHLGHFDNLLGNEDVEGSEQHQRLVHHLRQERREPVTPARHRRIGPLCAADSCLAA